MNATSVVGVWSQQLTGNLTVIVDTNRNQIIKRKNGRADKIFNVEKDELTLDFIGFTINLIETSEGQKETPSEPNRRS